MGKRFVFVAVQAQTLLAILILLVVAGAYPALRTWGWPVTGTLTERVSGRTVVIDAGHGGPDPGAVSASGLLEKDLTLAVALQLEQLLNRAAVHTVMVRTEDTDLADPGATIRKTEDLRRRVELGHAPGVDLYISLHANSFPNPAYSGAQTFYFPGRDEDRRLAEAIQASLRSSLGPNSRQANSGDYYVLRESKVPAVVVELGFLSHPEEARRLAEEWYQRELAEAIYDGIIDYLSGGAGPRLSN